MPKNTNAPDYTLIVSVASALFSICMALAIWILNSINSYVKKLYQDLVELMKDVEHLKGLCEERHKKK